MFDFNRKHFQGGSMEALLACHDSREGILSLSHKKRMIWRKQWK
jgi:hypothetical protein